MDADRTNAVLASIDGALADAEMPDGMRWHPDPGTVKGAPPPFDGQVVWQPSQRYEQPARPAPARTWLGPDCVAFAHGDCAAPARCLCTCHDRPPPPERGALLGRHFLFLDGGTLDPIAPPSAIAVRDAAAAAHREAMVGAMETAARDLRQRMDDFMAELGPAFQRFGEELRAAGIALIPGPPPRERPGPAEVRAAALAARQAGTGAGPRRPGPEQARRPRRHP